MHHRIKQWRSGEFCVVLSCRAVYSTPESPSPSALWHTTAQRSAPRHTASRNSRSTHNLEDHSLVLRPFIEQINSTHSLYTTSNLRCSELSITQANELVVVRTSLLAPHNQDDQSFVAFSDVVILNYNSTTFWCGGSPRVAIHRDGSLGPLASEDAAVGGCLFAQLCWLTVVPVQLVPSTTLFHSRCDVTNSESQSSFDIIEERNVC